MLLVSQGGYIKVNGCPWLGPILSLENSGWCITTEVSFCQNILILVIILVVKKVKSNDRQFTGANMTWVYSFHSNFGGKFHLLLFLFFKYFKGFTEVARQPSTFSSRCAGNRRWRAQPDT